MNAANSRPNSEVVTQESLQRGDEEAYRGSPREILTRRRVRYDQFSRRPFLDELAALVAGLAKQATRAPTALRRQKL
jgi:hypothetical protein